MPVNSWMSAELLPEPKLPTAKHEVVVGHATAPNLEGASRATGVLAVARPLWVVPFHNSDQVWPLPRLPTLMQPADETHVTLVSSST